jgi:hypothetical protein
MPAQPLDNSGVDADRQKLFFYHLRKWRSALKAKKEADAAMKNCGKAIKGDLGEFGLDELKDYETAQTPEGQERLKLKSEGILRALHLAGVPVGTQLDIFEDRAPIVERAGRAGYEAGMRGDALSNPYTEASEEGRAYAQRWHEGQQAIFAIGQLKDAEAAGVELIKGEGGEDEPAMQQLMDGVSKPKRGRPPKKGNGAKMDDAALAAEASAANAAADTAAQSIAN